VLVASGVMAWAVGTLGAGQKPVTIVTARPNKLLYRNHEPVRIQIEVRNNTGEPQEGTLACYILSEINRQRQVLKRTLELQPGEGKAVAASWNPGAEEYGFETLATWEQDGKPIEQNGEVFQVADYWPKVCIKTQTQEGFGPPGPLVASIESARDFYFNLVEFYEWAPYHGDLTPESGYYLSDNHGFLKSVPNMKAAIERAHQYGMKVQMYSEFTWLSYAVARQHPEFVLYNEYGQPRAPRRFIRPREYLSAMEERYDAFLRWDWNGPHRTEAADHYAREMVESIGLFGWDSIMCDSCDVTDDVLALISRQVRAKYPRFVFHANSGAPLRRKELQIILFEAGRWWIMPLTSRPNPQGIDTFHRVIQWVRRFRRAEKNVFMVGPLRSGGHAQTFCKMLAAIFASGQHARISDNGWPDLMRDYLRFASRYSAYIWHDDLERIPPGKYDIALSDMENFIWQGPFMTVSAYSQHSHHPHLRTFVPPPDYFDLTRGFEDVYERTLADGSTQLVIHLLNVQPEPKPQIVTLRLPEGASLGSAHALSPDWDNQAKSMSPRVEGSRVVLRPPEVENWAILVLDIIPRAPE